ncbi:hypothetical protein EJ02DRAFT_309853, partial [Clathrospora elynae]
DEAKRAASILTIAQLKFKQALKKEDAQIRLPPVSVEVSSQLFNDIDAVLRQNTRVNVQKCTEWIVKHVAPSKARIANLGDYLISVSKSIVADQNAPRPVNKAARNRIDVLLIVSDVLHTDKFHRRSTAKPAIFGDACSGFIAELVEQAAACVFAKDSQPEQKLRALLNFWTVNQLLSAEDLKACRNRADEGLLLAQGGTPVRKRNYLLPEYHGDRTAPWHDLPASYMLEQMIKNPNRPIDPTRIKIQKFDKKPVTPHVRNLLDNFFENLDIKYLPTGDNPSGETKTHKLSLDPIGQVVKQDKETGETATVSNGYGWSMKCCQDMQKHGVPQSIKIAREDIARMEEDVQGARIMPTARRDERSRRSSSAESDYKRDRRGHSRSRSYSHRGSGSSYDSRRSPSRSRSRDMAHSRRGMSPTPNRKGSDGRGQRYDDSGPSQPRPPPRPYGKDAPHTGSQWNGPNGPNRSQGNQYPAPPMPSQQYGQGYSQPPHVPFSAPQFPLQPPMPGQFPGQFPVPGFIPPPPPQFQGPGGFVPPPPPPNFNGPWQPPLPPPNMAGMPTGAQNFGNPYGNQYGNNFGPGNNQSFAPNQGGFAGGRGGYGGGPQQRGGYNGNRGGWGGPQRGQ